MSSGNINNPPNDEFSLLTPQNEHFIQSWLSSRPERPPSPTRQQRVAAHWRTCEPAAGGIRVPQITDHMSDVPPPATSSTQPTIPPPHPPVPHPQPGEPKFSTTDRVAETYYGHSSGTRVSTDALMASRLRVEHPDLALTIVSMDRYPPLISLLTYADATREASYKQLGEPRDPNSMPWVTKAYIPPAKRLDDGVVGGSIAQSIKFGRYEYHWKSHEFLLYIADGRDGPVFSPPRLGQYILHAATAEAENAAAELMRAAGSWQVSLHREIWVFDRGFWQKDGALYENVQQVSWDDVILDPQEKRMLQDDVTRFFDGRERYTKLRVPWKRGVIYHGPPGNGKTVSIKATMHTLYQRKPAVPTLYVRSFTTFQGPEAGIKAVFDKARTEAPCLLIFEDLDALVTDLVRSYFLNEVDGLASNDGIMIVGSTNHLDRLDPGLSKRPSRFDRKFLFPKPTKAQRVRYAEYWRGKLKDNEDIDFPEELSPKIAAVTDDFSFAYIQEAFVATLLVLASEEEGQEDAGSQTGAKRDHSGVDAAASLVMKEEEDGDLVKIGDDGTHSYDNNGGGDDDDDDDDKFKDNKFWQGFKKQVKILRSEM